MAKATNFSWSGDDPKDTFEETDDETFEDFMDKRTQGE